MPDPTNQDPAATKAAEKPSAAPESREVPEQEVTLAEYEQRVDRLKLDPNIEAAKSIEELKGSLKPEEQQEGLTALNTAIIHVLIKLHKKGVDLSEIKDYEDLEKAVHDSGITVTYIEGAALKNLERVLQEGGPTAKELTDSWDDRIETVQPADKQSLAKKYIAYFKKNPLATIALTVAGAAGIYLAYQGLKRLTKKVFGSLGGKVEEAESWFKKEIMIPIAIMAAGAILGKDLVKAILAEYGLDYDAIRDKIAKAKAFTSLELGKLKEVGARIRDALAKLGKEAAIKKIAEAIKFDEIKAKLLDELPVKPQWLKDLTLEQIAADLGLDPEKESAWKKYSGPGGAALLLYHWVTRKRKTDKAIAKVLKTIVESMGDKAEELNDEEGAEESEEDKGGQEPSGEAATRGELTLISKPGEPEIYRHPDGYELVPAKDAMRNYQIELYKTFSDVTKFVKENPGTVTVAAAYLASIEQIRAAGIGATKLGYHGFVELAKIPFKTLKNYPISTLFVISAIIAAESKFDLRTKAGEVLVPKDPENLKKYITAKLEHAKEHGEEWVKQIPQLQDEEIDRVINTIFHPEELKQYIGTAEEVLGNMIEGAVDRLTLSKEWQVQQANHIGFDIFHHDVLVFLQSAETKDSEKYKRYDELLKKTDEIMVMLNKGEKLTRNHIKELKPVADQVDIEFIYDSSGYVIWRHLEKAPDGSFTADPNFPGKRLAVDPEKSLDEAVGLAQRFVVEENLGNTLGKAPESALTSLRILVGDILFEDVETDEQAEKVLRREFRSGGMIVAHTGLELIIIQPAKGAYYRYFSIPENVIRSLYKIAKGEKVSASELMVEYGKTIIPVYIFGQARAILRADWQKVGFVKPLLRSAIHPLEWTYDVAMHFGRNLLFEEQKLKVIFCDPAAKIYSGVRSTSHKLLRLLSLNKDVRREREFLSRLYDAKEILHDCIYSTTRMSDRSAAVKRAIAALESTGNIDRVLEGMEISSETSDIRRAIAKIDEAINVRTDRLKAIVDGVADTASKAGKAAPRGERALRNAERIREAVREGAMSLDDAAKAGVKLDKLPEGSKPVVSGKKAAQNADEMLAEMEKAFEKMQKAKKAEATKTKIYEAVRETTTKALEALKAIGAGRPTAKLRILEVLKIANNEAKVLEASAEVSKLLCAVDKATDAGKTAKAARKGEQLAEATLKLREAEKAAKASRDAAKAARKGFLTTEEALRFGVRVEEVAAKGGKMMKFVRIGGRAFVVVDAALSVYDVYDQACELGKVLSVEYVETNSVRAAMDKISQHGERMAASARETESKENQKVVDQKDLSQKLAGARDLARRLQIHASQYAVPRRGVSGDSTFDQVWSIGGAVLSELTGTPTAMRLIYGSEDRKLRESENETIRMNIKYAQELVAQLKAEPKQTDEVRATIAALEASVEAANHAMAIDESAPAEVTGGASEKIDYARGLKKKARFIELLDRMARVVEASGGTHILVNQLEALKRELSEKDYKSLDDLDKHALDRYNALVRATNEAMLKDEVVITKDNMSYIVNAYLATHLPDLKFLQSELELWTQKPYDSHFENICRGMADAIIKPGMKVKEFDRLMKQNFSERHDERGEFIFLEANMVHPDAMAYQMIRNTPTFEKYLWDPQTFGYVLALCNYATKHPAYGSSGGAYVEDIKTMLNDKKWRDSIPENAKKGGPNFFKWVKRSLKERGLESPDKYFGYKE